MNADILKRATNAAMLTKLKAWFTHQDECYRCGKESAYPHRQDSLCDDGRTLWRLALKAMNKLAATGATGGGAGRGFAGEAREENGA